MLTEKSLKLVFSMPSFDKKKAIRFVITLATGTFGASSANQITLEGFRATAEIDKAGWQQMGTLRAQIYGVSQSDINAWGDYNSMPDVFLEVQAQTAYANQLQPVAPTSFKGATDVATLMGQLAANMGYSFENNGVQKTISNPYLSNTG